jgi:hypothetical protein
MKKLVLVAFVPSARELDFERAQSAPQADVAAGYSALYTIWNNGASGSAAYYVNDWLGVVGDLGAYVGHVPQTLTGETYTAGPRFSYRKNDRFVPFVQALFGGSHFSASTGGITGSENEFAFALGGGVDFGVDHDGKYAVRPQFEYFGIRSGGSTTGAARLSIRLVYRIGKRIP